MSKHMPGPWDYIAKLSGSENHRGYRIVADGGWPLAEVQPGDEDGKMGKANASLIAAAPDLLEALQAADVYLSHMPNDIAKDLLVIAMRAAIKKAKGEPR